jgi:hypothetical protein
MSSAEYYRTEAERCHKLAETSKDQPEAARRWRALASDYNILADEIERVPTDVRLYNAHTMDEALLFMAGDPLPDGREVK